MSDLNRLKCTAHRITCDLEYYNRWRRGDDETDMPGPKEIGILLDETVVLIKQMLDELNA